MGQPDPRWAEAPEFNWIPDQPFRAKYPPTANSNEPADSRKSAETNGAARLSVAAGKSVLGQMAASAESANSPLLARLMIGVLQGFCLAFLAKDQSMTVSAAIMVFLFVPLLLLAGLGPVPGRLLLPWTAITAFILGASGTYQYWRGGSLDGATIALTAISLFVGQVLVMVWARNGKPPV